MSDHCAACRGRELARLFRRRREFYRAGWFEMLGQAGFCRVITSNDQAGRGQYALAVQTCI